MILNLKQNLKLVRRRKTERHCNSFLLSASTVFQCCQRVHICPTWVSDLILIYDSGSFHFCSNMWQHFILLYSSGGDPTSWSVNWPISTDQGKKYLHWLMALVEYCMIRPMCVHSEYEIFAVVLFCGNVFPLVGNHRCTFLASPPRQCDEREENVRGMN